MTASHVVGVDFPIQCPFAKGPFTASDGIGVFLPIYSAIVRGDGTADGTLRLPLPSAAPTDYFEPEVDLTMPRVVGRHLIVAARTREAGGQLWAYDLDAILVDGFDQ